MEMFSRRSFLGTLLAAPLAGLAGLGFIEREPTTVHIDWMCGWGPLEAGGICHAEVRWRPVWGKRIGEWRKQKFNVTKDQPMCWLTKNIGVGWHGSFCASKVVEMDWSELRLPEMNGFIAHDSFMGNWPLEVKSHCEAWGS